jgi:hypothetical protein
MVAPDDGRGKACLARRALGFFSSDASSKKLFSSSADKPVTMEHGSLAHEMSVAYQHALSLCGTVHEIADTGHRATNERLKLHATCLLEHTACLEREASRSSRAIRSHYARLALAKLGASIDAARSARLISDRHRGCVREQLIALEQLLDDSNGREKDPVLSHKSDASNGGDRGNNGGGGDGSGGGEGGDGSAGTQVRDVQPADDFFSAEELLELKQLIERDSRPASTSAADLRAPVPGS